MYGRIGQALKIDKHIGIMGCSDIGWQLADDLKKLNEQIKIVFLDNDLEKQQNEFEKYKVISPQKSNDIELYIIASIKFYREMKKQLLDLGIDQNDIFFADTVWKQKEKDSDYVIEKRKAKKEINFVVDLAEHCNLKCQNCDHFSPLAKKKFSDIKEFESDIKRMSDLFRGEENKITHVDLEGGEPLLNPNITDYIEIVYRYMPKSLIKIFTNGILLEKQSKKFWDICKKYAVILEVTKYPIQVNYERIECIAKNYGVSFEYFSGGDCVKESFHKPLDLKGKNNKYDSFNKCYMGNGDCVMLKHGHIYPCTVVPNINIFNEFFNQNIKVGDKDSINIYEAKSAQEILDFLANPIPACRYCQPDKWTGGHKWKTTTYKMSEWADCEN